MLARTLVSTIAVSLAVMAGASYARADEPTDTVFLANGGRVRGTVIEEDPATGVRLKLLDGTVRNISHAELARVQYGRVAEAVAVPVPAPSVADANSGEGTLHVDTSEPATVDVDDSDEIDAPTNIDHLEEGRHQVRVTFLAGGSVTKTVRVRAGQVTKTHIEPGEAQIIARIHAGAHFGLGAEGGFLWQRETFIPGGGVTGGLTYGVAPRLDLSVSLGVSAYTGSLDLYHYGDVFFTRLPQCFNHYDRPATCTLSDATQTSIPIRGRVDLQLNLSTVYSMVFGIDAGVSVSIVSATATTSQQIGPIAPTVDILPMFGLHGSIATFRFGARRQFTLSLQEGVLLGPLPAFEQTLGLRYTFL